MNPIESNSQTETPVWSAHHLPNPKASRMLSFSVLAVTVGLVVIVLASAVKDPIRTTGTQMEPTRFTAATQQENKTAIVIAAGTN